MRLGVVPLLGFIIPRVAFNQGERFLLSSAVGGQRGGIDLGLKGYASEVLLLIVFSYGKLIICDVVTLQGTCIIGDSLLEFFVLLLKRFLKVGHDLGPLPFEAQLADGLLDSNAQVCFLDYILQLRD